MYFFFNEGNEKIKTTALINGNGKAEIWDASSANIFPINDAISKNGKVNISLELNGSRNKIYCYQKLTV